MAVVRGGRLPRRLLGPDRLGGRRGPGGGAGGVPHPLARHPPAPAPAPDPAGHRPAALGEPRLPAGDPPSSRRPGGVRRRGGERAGRPGGRGVLADVSGLAPPRPLRDSGPDLPPGRRILRVHAARVHRGVRLAVRVDVRRPAHRGGRLLSRPRAVDDAGRLGDPAGSPHPPGRPRRRAAAAAGRGVLARCLRPLVLAARRRLRRGVRGPARHAPGPPPPDGARGRVRPAAAVLGVAADHAGGDRIAGPDDRRLDRRHRPLPLRRSAVRGDPQRTGPGGSLYPQQHRGDPARLQPRSGAGAAVPRHREPDPGERPGQPRGPRQRPALGLPAAPAHLPAAAGAAAVLHVYERGHRPVPDRRAGAAGDALGAGARHLAPHRRGADVGQRPPGVHARLRAGDDPGEPDLRGGPARLLHQGHPAAEPHRAPHRPAGAVLRPARQPVRDREDAHEGTGLRPGRPERVHVIRGERRRAPHRPAGEARVCDPVRGLAAAAEQRCHGREPGDLSPRGDGAGRPPGADADPGPRSLPGARRRPPVLDRGRLHHQRRVSVLASGGRGQLHPQLREGRGGRLRRRDPALRRGSRGPARPGLRQDLPRPLPADGGAAAVARLPSPVSRRPVHAPGRGVLHVSHEGSAGLLQPRGSLGVPQ